MNTEETTSLDPFEASTLDEAAELAALVRTLELAEGFRLLFVRCNQLPQREQLIEEVRARLPKLNIQTISFREPIQHLLDSIQTQLTAPLPDAVFVSGLEASLPVPAEAPTAPLIANLNASRNSFAQRVPCPLVLWVPEYVLTAIAQGAPDFFSIRSSVYFFAAQSTEIARLSRSLSAREFWEVENLSQREKQDRITAIERLLADYEFLPDEQRDHQTELRLLDQLGALFYVQGEYDTALRHYQQALTLAKRLGDQASEIDPLYNIARIYEERGEYEAALSLYEQMHRIAQEIADPDGIASALQSIGTIFHARREYDAALVQYTQALQIREQLGDRKGVASLLHGLGNLYSLRGEYDAALAQYTQALKIRKQLGDRKGEASLLHALGNLHDLQGEYDAALAPYMQSLKIREELSDHQGMASLLYDIGNLHYQRGEYAAAVKQYVQSLRISEDLGDREGTARIGGQVGVLFTQAGFYPEAFEAFRLALVTLGEMQSPNVQTLQSVFSNFKKLRTEWGEQNFDAAWQQATGKEVPEALLLDSGKAT